MWIYTKSEKGAVLLNTDHIARFYVNKGGVYANIGDCDIERVIGLESEEAALGFMSWLANHIGPYPGSKNAAETFNGTKVAIIPDGTTGKGY